MTPTESNIITASLNWRAARHYMAQWEMGVIPAHYGQPYKAVTAAEVALCEAVDAMARPNMIRKRKSHSVLPEKIRAATEACTPKKKTYVKKK